MKTVKFDLMHKTGILNTNQVFCKHLQGENQVWFGKDNPFDAAKFGNGCRVRVARGTFRRDPTGPGSMIG
jgi:hypothetical protein